MQDHGDSLLLGDTISLHDLRAGDRSYRRKGRVNLSSHYSSLRLIQKRHGMGTSFDDDCSGLCVLIVVTPCGTEVAWV
jgi:hypothetical protein